MIKFLISFIFVFLQFLADQFVSEPASHFQMGQTVMAKVWNRYDLH